MPGLRIFRKTSDFIAVRLEILIDYLRVCSDVINEYTSTTEVNNTRNGKKIWRHWIPAFAGLTMRDVQFFSRTAISKI